VTLPQKEIVNELRVQWKQLWQERLEDKVKAEGIANTDYSKLFVEKGTIIHATRDFKPLNFKEIIEKNKIENPELYVQPSPHVGGWGKFIKTEITIKKIHRHNRADVYRQEKKKVLQSKKSRRGWLHL